MVVYSFCGLVGYSRIYLGAHGMNQVLLGYVYGLLINILFINIYFLYFKKLTQRLILKAADQTQRQKITSLAINLFCYALVNALMIIIYEIQKNN